MSEHLTSEQMTDLLTGERPAQAARHVRECPACRAEVESLGATFAQFRESAQRWSVHHMRNPQSRDRRGAVAAAVAVAAAIVLAAVLVQGSTPAARAEAPFVEIPYVAPLAPYERASVMRMEMPVAALAAAGLRVHGSEPGATVTADVLVGQDGRAHAVRLTSNRSVIQ